MDARSLRRSLLTCVAALAIVAPAADAAAFGTPGSSPGASSSYYGIDASSLHAGSGTTDADIDAVPGLRAQLNDKAAREAQAADAATPTVRVQRGTTDADIDAVPGLRAQLNDKAAREAQAADAATPTVRVQRGTTDADIDAVPGLRAQLNDKAAREAALVAAATTADTTDAADGFQWGDAAIGAAVAAAVLGPAPSWRSASAAAMAGRPASRSTSARRSRVGTTPARDRRA